MKLRELMLWLWGGMALGGLIVMIHDLGRSGVCEEIKAYHPEVKLYHCEGE